MTIEQHEGRLNDKNLKELLALYAVIFGQKAGEKELNRLNEAEDLFTLFFRDDSGAAVAYKTGYRQSSGIFYSWIGGTLPEWRGQGLAQRLMETQHQWAARRGYHSIQTKTMNRWKNMLILNLRNGFEITGTYPANDGVLRIVLEKKLLT